MTGQALGASVRVHVSTLTSCLRFLWLQALRSCGAVDLTAALDWLCLRVSDDELTAAFPDTRAEIQAQRVQAVARSEALARRLAIIRERNKQYVRNPQVVHSSCPCGSW